MAARMDRRCGLVYAEMGWQGRKHQRMIR
jgi:hypothetical protein